MATTLVPAKTKHRLPNTSNRVKRNSEPIEKLFHSDDKAGKLIYESVNSSTVSSETRVLPLQLDPINQVV
jgi:hypothetical protein